MSHQESNGEGCLKIVVFAIMGAAMLMLIMGSAYAMGI